MIPIERHLERFKSRRNVSDRLKRMNPYGVAEGCIPRGWHPKPTLRYHMIMRDLVSVREFRTEWGEQPLMWLHCQNRIIKLGGKRRAVTMQDYRDPFRF